MFCLLLLSRISVEIIFPVPVASGSFSAIAGIIGSEIVRFVLALPILVYAFKGNNIFGGICSRSKIFGWIIAVIVSVLLTAECLLTLFLSAEFTVKNLLIGGSMWTIFIVAAIFALYAAVMGTEALARTGSIIIIAVGIVTVSVILADIPYMTFSGAFSDVQADSELLITGLVSRIMRGGEYLIFAALMPYVQLKTENSAGKTGLYFALFSLLGTTVLCGLCALILRELFGLTEYPFISAASLSDLSFFKRLDGAAGAVWLLAAVFRGGLLLLSAESVISAAVSASKLKTRVKRGENN